MSTYQCWGSGSASGSKCFGPSGSVSLQAKLRKTLISTVLQLLYVFLSLKNDVNIPVFRIRIRIGMFLGLPDPHPLVRGTDPRIRIRTKMPRIPNTVCYNWDKMLQFYLRR
jgi:hypothetical protein